MYIEVEERNWIQEHGRKLLRRKKSYMDCSIRIQEGSSKLYLLATLTIM